MSYMSELSIEHMNYKSEYTKCSACGRLAIINKTQGLVYEGWFICQCGHDLQEVEA